MSYKDLFVALVCRRDGELLLPPKLDDIERNEEWVTLKVCAATGMTPERWDRLDEAGREPWLEKTLKVLAGEKPTTESPNAITSLSATALADKHKVDGDKLRKRLDRWRCDHDVGYVEVQNKKPRQPKYLYDEAAVMPVIEKLQVDAEKRVSKRRRK